MISMISHLDRRSNAQNCAKKSQNARVPGVTAAAQCLSCQRPERPPLKHSSPFATVTCVEFELQDQQMTDSANCAERIWSLQSGSASNNAAHSTLYAFERKSSHFKFVHCISFCSQLDLELQHNVENCVTVSYSSCHTRLSTCAHCINLSWPPLLE